MNAKDLELIAHTIKGMSGEDFEGLRPVIAREFARVLASELDLSVSKRAQFLRDCGAE